MLFPDWSFSMWTKFINYRLILLLVFVLNATQISANGPIADGAKFYEDFGAVSLDNKLSYDYFNVNGVVLDKTSVHELLDIFGKTNMMEIAKEEVNGYCYTSAIDDTKIIFFTEHIGNHKIITTYQLMSSSDLIPPIESCAETSLIDSNLHIGSNLSLRMNKADVTNLFGNPSKKHDGFWMYKYDTNLTASESKDVSDTSVSQHLVKTTTYETVYIKFGFDQGKVNVIKIRRLRLN